MPNQIKSPDDYVGFMALSRLCWIATGQQIAKGMSFSRKITCHRNFVAMLVVIPVTWSHYRSRNKVTTVLRRNEWFGRTHSYLLWYNKTHLHRYWHNVLWNKKDSGGKNLNSFGYLISQSCTLNLKQSMQFTAVLTCRMLLMLNQGPKLVWGLFFGIPPGSNQEFITLSLFQFCPKLVVLSVSSSLESSLMIVALLLLIESRILWVHWY